MSLTLLIILSIIIQLSVSLDETKPYYDLNNAEEIFMWFLKTYDKKYPTKLEEQIRFRYFVTTLKQINFLNVANSHAVFDINKFADLSKEEFLLMHMGYVPDLVYKSTVGPPCTTFYDKNITTNYAPQRLDWREKNKVTKVRDQGKCGSCWAFSTIGNIEGQYAIAINRLLKFSEQELVDCMVDSDGCNGGDTLITMKSLKLFGVESEAEYPYTAKTEKCKFDKSKVKVQIAGCHNYDLNDENKIKEVLYNVGPLSIVLDATVLHSYSDGVMNFCKGREQNHAVLLVGYGTDNDKDYWLIKNSWGEGWGEKGYFRLQRGINACGLVNDEIGSAILRF